nr:type VI secretion system-associated protein VasI [uncultured Pseudomonas sp.]
MSVRHVSVFGLLLLFNSAPGVGSVNLDCRNILSNIERLACFDQAAGTPRQAVDQKWSAPEQDAPTVRRVLALEAGRPAEDLTFRLGSGEYGLLITAPAIASGTPSPYLAISCVQNITRLQLITAQPIEAGRVSVRLRGDRGQTATTAWQVTENGQVLDAGRGLPGIEQLKQLIGAQRIHVQSDHPAVDGLVFDAQGLDPLIDEARRTCRW